MKRHWESQPIGSLCQLVNGRAFKPSDWAQHGLPIVRIQNLNDEGRPFNHYCGEVHNRHLIGDGDVLLSWSGTPGTSFGCFVWTRGQAILNQHIFQVLVDRSKMHKEFFVHAVNSRLDEMISLAHGGVGLRHITKGRLERIELPVPPLAEQLEIVALIRYCLERVHEIQQLRTATRIAATTLLSSFLGDIERASCWPVLPLGELIETRNGRSVRSTGNGGNGYVLTLSAVRDVSLDLLMRKHVELDVKTAQTFQVKCDDVFVSRSNTRDLVGLSAIADADPQDTIVFPDLLIRLRPIDIRVIPRFLAYSLRFPSVREQIKARAKGTSQSMVKISGASLKEVMVPLPPRSTQEAVLVNLDEASEVNGLLANAFDSVEPAALRQAILRKALAGERKASGSKWRSSGSD